MKFPHVLCFAILGVGGALMVGFTPPKTSPPEKRRGVTYASDVAPILYSKCSSCHHQGEVAPFNLMSYDDAKAKAHTILAVVQHGFMPPWGAKSHGEFTDERTLTHDQIETLKSWVDSGAPAGDLSKAPRPPSYIPGWQMGKPDFLGEPTASYPVSAEGTDDYRCFVIPTNFPTDKFISGVEIRPGNAKVVHHVLVYLDSKKVARNIKSADGKPGYVSFGGPGFSPTGSLGGWAPGTGPQILRPGLGFMLPKGADIVMQVHYHKNGKPESDLTKIGLKFATGPVDKEMIFEGLGDETFSIPGGTKNYEVQSSLNISKPITLFSVSPHMHLLGRDMKVTATYPDGHTKTLVDVNKYDYNWQTRYTYKQPVPIPPGTKLSLVAHFDNSAENPKNPNSPPKTVQYGEKTTDEMCFAFFDFTEDSEHLINGQKADETSEITDDSAEVLKIFSRFDENKDGFLDQKELTELLSRIAELPPKKSEEAAQFVIAFFGKTQKGKLSLAEFVKASKAK